MPTPQKPYPWQTQGIREVRGDIGRWAMLARQTAFELPVYDGDIERNSGIVGAARSYLHNFGAMACLTRDNMVKLGFWKNIDYENCLHLSISFKHPTTAQPDSWNDTAARTIVRAVFGEARHMLWWEPPYSERGKVMNVQHWRLFYAPDWITPIMPKNEPHTLNMPADWKGWTEYQEAQPTPNFNADITVELPLRRNQS